MMLEVNHVSLLFMMLDMINLDLVETKCIKISILKFELTV